MASLTIAEQINKLNNSINSLRSELLRLAAVTKPSAEDQEDAMQIISLMRTNKARLACLTEGR